MIQVAISVSGTPAETEPRGLDKEDGKQPDGWTLYPWTIQDIHLGCRYLRNHDFSGGTKNCLEP